MRKELLLIINLTTMLKTQVMNILTGSNEHHHRTQLI